MSDTGHRRGGVVKAAQGRGGAMATDDLMHAINLRDLGGAPTMNGARVRRGLIFRSAALSDVAGARLDAIRALGIRTIVDFRRNAEREARPTPWEALGCADYWCRDHQASGADLAPRLRAPTLSAEDSRAAMTELYASLPYEQADSYRQLFGAVIDGRTPLLFHCAVGKDRTGVGAALILAALGVARETIVADYLRTVEFDIHGSAHMRGLPRRSPERAAALAPVLGVEVGYLTAMFDTVARRSGSVEAYLADTLGLDPDARRAFRVAMLEPGGSE